MTAPAELSTWLVPGDPEAGPGESRSGGPAPGRTAPVRTRVPRRAAPTRPPSALRGSPGSGPESPVARPAACPPVGSPAPFLAARRGTRVRVGAPGGPASSPPVRVSPAHVLAAAVVTLAVVAALGWLGQEAGTGATAVPAQTSVIQVGAGETVWDVAQRVAPGSDPRAVVDRIHRLNNMVGSAVEPGQWLRVPDGR